jgi:hypothetical protein
MSNGRRHTVERSASKVKKQWDVAVGASCAAADSVLTSPMPLLTTCAVLNLHGPKCAFLYEFHACHSSLPCRATAKHVHWLIGMEASFCHTVLLLSGSGVKMV